MDDDTRAWHHHLEQLAIPLCLLDRDGNPQKPGTGTLVDFCGRTILLTAAHVDEGLQDTSWAILLRYDEALAEAQFYTLGPLRFFYRVRLGQDGSGESIDVVTRSYHPTFDRATRPSRTAATYSTRTIASSL